MTAAPSLYSFVSQADLAEVRKQAVNLDAARRSGKEERIEAATAEHYRASAKALAAAVDRAELEYVATAKKLAELWEVLHAAQSWSATADRPAVFVASDFEAAVLPATKRTEGLPNLRPNGRSVAALFYGGHATELGHPARAYARLVGDWNRAGLAWPSQWRSH